MIFAGVIVGRLLGQARPEVRDEASLEKLRRVIQHGEWMPPMYSVERQKLLDAFNALRRGKP